MKNCDRKTSHPEGAKRPRDLVELKTITEMEKYRYVVYILTNNRKNVLYTGVTSNFKQRLIDHKNGSKGWFTKKYQCHFMIYYEYFKHIIPAIDREKEIKGLSREKKEKLISEFNPEWRFLNDEVVGL